MKIAKLENERESNRKNQKDVKLVKVKMAKKVPHFNKPLLNQFKL